MHQGFGQEVGFTGERLMGVGERRFGEEGQE